MYDQNTLYETEFTFLTPGTSHAYPSSTMMFIILPRGVSEIHDATNSKLRLHLDVIDLTFPR